MSNIKLAWKIKGEIICPSLDCLQYLWFQNLFSYLLNIFIILNIKGLIAQSLYLMSNE